MMNEMIAQTTAEQAIANAHHNAQSMIDWLSLPSVAERYQILDVGYIIGLFRLLMESCTKQEAIADIELLVEYVKLATVGQGVQV